MCYRIHFGSGGVCVESMYRDTGNLVRVQGGYCPMIGVLPLKGLGSNPSTPYVGWVIDLAVRCCMYAIYHDPCYI